MQLREGLALAQPRHAHRTTTFAWHAMLANAKDCSASARSGPYRSTAKSTRDMPKFIPDILENGDQQKARGQYAAARLATCAREPGTRASRVYVVLSAKDRTRRRGGRGRGFAPDFSEICLSHLLLTWSSKRRRSGRPRCIGHSDEFPGFRGYPTKTL